MMILLPIWITGTPSWPVFCIISSLAFASMATLWSVKSTLFFLKKSFASMHQWHVGVEYMSTFFVPADFEAPLLESGMTFTSCLIVHNCLCLYPFVYKIGRA